MAFLDDILKQTEAEIANLETELKTLEEAFANPGPDMDWKIKNRRHAEIQSTLDRLYEELSERWKELGQ